MKTLDDLKTILHAFSDLVVGAKHLHDQIDALSDETDTAPAPAPQPDAAAERDAEKAQLRQRLAELEAEE